MSHLAFTLPLFLHSQLSVKRNICSTYLHMYAGWAQSKTRLYTQGQIELVLGIYFLPLLLHIFILYFYSFYSFLCFYDD